MVCGKMSANPNGGANNFDNIMYSLLNVFVITSMEGWSGIMDFLRETFNDAGIFYCICVVFLCGFFVMNMMLAVIKAKFSEM
jgi:TctA family transporter